VHILAQTGGFLWSGMDMFHELNQQAVMRCYGQELNPESYAICKADMLIKGQEVRNIKLGNTLSNDQLYADKFDYMRQAIEEGFILDVLKN
jgi:type I restriction enzyme M protein